MSRTERLQKAILETRIDKIGQHMKSLEDFARESLEVAINRGDLMGDDISEDLIGQWKKLTGEVYGKDYCQREVPAEQS